MTAGDGSILIIGRNGQLSRSLHDVLGASGHRILLLGRPDVDLRDPQSLTRAVLAARPKIVINAAAYTAVDRAEDEPEEAHAVNTIGAEAAARAAAEAGAPIIHFSTDYVFDGKKLTPYLETDGSTPIGVYGATKLAGEKRVAAANPKHTILRTAWLFSEFGNNFVKTMLRLNEQLPELRVVDDQHGCPTFAGDIAEVIAKLIPTVTTSSPDPCCFGIFHAVNHGEATWFGLARAIIEGAAARGAKRANVMPIATQDYPTRAQRPESSLLSTRKLHDVYGIRMRPWQEALSDCLDRLIGPLSTETETHVQKTAGRFV